jgi:hypothetical protein
MNFFGISLNFDSSLCSAKFRRDRLIIFSARSGLAAKLETGINIVIIIAAVRPQIMG